MCDCIDKTAKLLDPHNTRLVVSMSLVGKATRVIVNTVKINPRKYDHMTLQAAFCPFCGKPYDEQKKQDQ